MTDCSSYFESWGKSEVGVFLFLRKDFQGHDLTATSQNVSLSLLTNRDVHNEHLFFLNNVSIRKWRY